MEENVRFKRNVIKLGGSKVLPIPTEILDFLKIDAGDNVIITVDNRKHGKFAAFWKNVKK